MKNNSFGESLHFLSKKINKKSEQLLIQSEKRTDVNEPLHAIKINTKYGEKEISVYAADIASFKGNIDVLTTSAFIHSYFPKRYLRRFIIMVFTRRNWQKRLKLI